MRFRLIFSVIAALLATIAISACGGGGGSSQTTKKQAASALGSTGKPVHGGTITFAEQPGSTPTYIFPLYDGANSANDDITYLQPLMWKPLYWFGHPDSAAATIDDSLSMADPPVFSHDDKTVTMKLRSFKWSNGKPVTSRDVLFWMNELLAEKANYAGYVPGGILDHVASMSTPNPSTFVLKLNKSYNETYLLYNGLALITPMPQASWDKTSANGPVGNYDETPAGAKKVYAYLNKASMSLSTWDTNPIWQVVDGPWHLKPGTGFQTTGQVTMLPNKSYSGSDKPYASEFQELPFTSAEAEFNALQAGSVDYGYVPTTDVADIGSLKSRGDKIDPWYEWGLTFVGFNFSNPKYAPLMNQLYIRQAMEHLVNQPEYINAVLKGYGSPTYGPVPAYPKTPFLSKAGATNQFPFSPTAAKTLLTSHGWKIPASGAATCAKPGSGADECGAGITSGEKLSMPLLYPTGFPAIQTEVQATQSAFAQAGISITLQESPENTVLSESYACIGKSTSSCPASSTAMSIISSPVYTYVPIYYPVGDSLFKCGGATNGGNYCSKQVDASIDAVLDNTTSSLAPLYRYQVQAAKQVPVLWFPNSAYQISAITSKLDGVDAQDSTAHIYPQSWWVNK